MIKIFKKTKLFVFAITLGCLLIQPLLAASPSFSPAITSAYPSTAKVFHNFQGNEPLIIAEAEIKAGAYNQELGWILAECTTEKILNKETEGIRLNYLTDSTTDFFPYPAAMGPGKDVLPWVVLPWQLSFSPDGQYILLITMEGYPEQYADYFRLWVLNLAGQEVDSKDGCGILRAHWLDNDTIAYWDFKDEALSQGDLFIWQFARPVKEDFVTGE